MCNVEGPPLKKHRPQLLHSTDPLPIYLDYNATTPVCNEAWIAMNGCRTHWGNPSSSHAYGLDANFVVQKARAECAEALGVVDAQHVIFTSGGTEANNLAIMGGSRAARAAAAVAGSTSTTQLYDRDVIIATNTEHPAVEEVLKAMESLYRDQWITVRVPVDDITGLLTPDRLQQFLEHDLVTVHGLHPHRVALVSFMHANNELGTVHDIPKLVQVTKRVCGDGAGFHTDASQSIGKVPVQVEAFGVDYLTVCSHKFYGPKGVGALCLGSRALKPLKTSFGAGHEGGLRPGTENIILYAGMAAALTKACADVDAVAQHLRRCRDVLHNELLVELAKKPGMVLQVNGDVTVALPNTLNVAIKYAPSAMYISAQRLITDLGHTVALSAGSACHSSLKPGEDIVVSAPLRAIGVDVARAVGTLRLTCGRDSTPSEMRRAARFIARKAIQQIADA